MLVVVCAAAVHTAKSASSCQVTTERHRWLVAPQGLSCSDAKKVVQTLAKKKVPAGAYFPGTYQGMKCISTSRTGTKPQYIGCASKTHSRSMVAFRQ